MIKFRWYYDVDKEEKFLNQMSVKGYEMRKYFLGFYKFQKTEPNEYTYRIDLVNDKTDKELRDYINLIEDTGAELVQKWGVWAYFRKKGEFSLYTDIDSKINFYLKIRTMFLSLGVAEILISFSQWSNFLLRPLKLAFTIGIFLCLIGMILLYQAYKCHKKIKQLKKNNK